jgi:hypothetical protein
VPDAENGLRNAEKTVTGYKFQVAGKYKIHVFTGLPFSVPVTCNLEPGTTSPLPFFHN